MQHIARSGIWSTVTVALLWAGSWASAQTASELKLVASTRDLAALAQEVAGDRCEIEFLAPGSQDPHTVPGKPSYLLKLRHADLLIVVGMGLDAGWLTGAHHVTSAISQSGNARIQLGRPGYFDASQYAEILEVPTGASVRDIHPFGNPHYWLDPENGRRIARALANKLDELRPDDAVYFENRFQVFSKRLSEAEQVWAIEMKPYRGRKVITYRRSWSNFLKYFQLISVGEIEPSPGIPPSRRHTTELINLMKQENVNIILMEPYFEVRTPDAIARQTSGQIVVVPSSVGGEIGINDYFKLFEYDLSALVRALGVPK